MDVLVVSSRLYSHYTMDLPQEKRKAARTTSLFRNWDCRLSELCAHLRARKCESDALDTVR